MTLPANRLTVFRGLARNQKKWQIEEVRAVLEVTATSTKSVTDKIIGPQIEERGVWWLIGRFVAFRPKGREFESRSSRHVGTLGKSFTRSCLWRFDVKLRHSIRAVVGSASE